MHEPRDTAARPRDWHGAFAGLPLETPPAAGWSRLQARLEPARRRSAPRWWVAAAAAMVVLAVTVPALRHTPPLADSAPDDTSAQRAAPSAEDPLRQLYAESEQLESLVRLTRDDRVGSGTAVAVASDLDARIAAIDGELMQPDLSGDRQLVLWTARVETLRAIAGLEGTRRWLAAQGSRYDSALARVD